jgi:hypothetical protein
MPCQLLLGGLRGAILQLEGGILLGGLERLPGFGEVLEVQRPGGHVAGEFNLEVL